jgi:hypothetical protein
MEANKTTNETATPVSSTGQGESRNGRRGRWEMNSDNVRYFLPKPGSSASKPELGQEMTDEGGTLVEAFKSGQVFYTLVAWKATTKINGGRPEIVKQVMPRS